MIKVHPIPPITFWYKLYYFILSIKILAVQGGFKLVIRGEKLKKERENGPKILLRGVKKGKFFPNKMPSVVRGLELIFENALFSIEIIGNGFLIFIQDLSDLRIILKSSREISKYIHNKENFDTDFTLWKFQIERNTSSMSDSQILDLIEKEFKANGNPIFPIRKIKKALEISFPNDNLGFEKFAEFIKDFKANLDDK